MRQTGRRLGAPWPHLMTFWNIRSETASRREVLTEVGKRGRVVRSCTKRGSVVCFSVQAPNKLNEELRSHYYCCVTAVSQRSWVSTRHTEGLRCSGCVPALCSDSKERWRSSVRKYKLNRKMCKSALKKKTINISLFVSNWKRLKKTDHLILTNVFNQCFCQISVLSDLKTADVTFCSFAIFLQEQLFLHCKKHTISTQ